MKMNLETWTPLSDFRRDFDHFLSDWLTLTDRDFQDQSHNHMVPKCDIEEEEGHYLLSLEMPGISKDEIKVEVIDDKVVVSGERRQTRHSGNRDTDKLWYTERRYGKFQRSFTLPAGTNADKVEADYRDGILRIAVPKSEATRPRQIKVTNGSGTGLLSKLLGQAKEPSTSAKVEKVA